MVSQRITSLYLIITGNIPPYYEDKEITNDTRGLFVNLENGELQYYKKTIMENNPLWVELTEVFQDNNKILMNLLNKDEFKPISEKILETHGKIKGILQTNFVEQVIPIEANIRKQLTYFIL